MAESMGSGVKATWVQILALLLFDEYLSGNGAKNGTFFIEFL